ncbi:NAD(P)/FAD-dependent oxidoreductase [Sphaerisporangium sp. NPDC051011]|uniref:NAD(P)/FAD-dependent oxidoreductase n=1 Tax=Sphaerisporangium sp. NPDC051011 TaxID=3155792 RepID=UPI0033E8CD53
MNRLSVCVIGGGLAGSSVAHELMASGRKVHVTVVDDDPDSPYDRPPLTKRFLDDDFDAVAEPGWAVQGATWLRDRAVAMNIRERIVVLESGRRLAADVIVLATGGRPRSQSADLWGFSLVRTAADALWLRERVAAVRSASVLIEGAGPLGSEMATTLSREDVRVTLVEVDRLPMRRLLGPELGKQVARWAADAGVDLRLERHITSSSRLPGDAFDVTLSDGSHLHADIALSAIGMTPATELVAGWAAADGRGVHCDPQGHVLSMDGEAYPHVYAVGDAAAYTDPVTDALVHHESWTNAAEQGAAVAAEILGEPATSRRLPYFWTEVFGRRVQILGTVPVDPSPPEVLALYPERKGAVYRFDDEGRQAAWVAVNAPRDFAAIMQEQQAVVT